MIDDKIPRRINPKGIGLIYVYIHIYVYVPHEASSAAAAQTFAGAPPRRSLVRRHYRNRELPTTGGMSSLGFRGSGV